MSKYRMQGEVTIHVDYIEDDADSEAIAIKAAKEWAKDEYRLYGLGWDDCDISITAELIEEEVPQ